MNKKQALCAAHKLQGDLAHSATLSAEEVRSTGALLGIDDEGLLAAVIKLSEQCLVRLPGGGSLQILPCDEISPFKLEGLLAGLTATEMRAGAVGEGPPRSMP